MLMEGKQLEAMRETAAVHEAAQAESRHKTMETLERTMFDGKECYKVKLVRKSGKEILQFFDVKTGLLVGQQGKQESPMGAFDVTTSLDDYKEFDGVRTAAKTTVDLGILKQVLTIDSVEYDKVDDKVFALPPQIKGLLNK